MPKRLLPFAIAVALLVAAPRARAQVLGPQRKFLSLTPYATVVRLDAGSSGDHVDRFGYGARLLVNVAPFSGPAINLADHLMVGGYISHAQKEGTSILQYGGELDVHFPMIPYGVWLDPLLLLGAGGLRTSTDTSTGDVSSTDFVLAPGIGFRIPVDRRFFELRLDARDNIAVNHHDLLGERHTLHDAEITAGLSVTF